MKKIRILGLAALLALSVGAMGAATAQATEGPHYKVAGALLVPNLTQPFETKANKTFLLVAGTDKIECTALKVKEGKFIGAGANNTGDTSSETLEFEKCTLEGQGEGCKIENETIIAKAVNELGYEDKERKAGTKLYVLFKPASGSVFTKFKILGAKCTPIKDKEEVAVEGTVDGEAWDAAGNPVLIGSEPAEAVEGQVNFPETKIAKEFYEEAGALKEKTASLKAFGKAVSKFTGRAGITLPGNKLWCITTKAAGSKC
jgi:hypothetical protein